MDFQTGEQLAAWCGEHGKSLGEAMLCREQELLGAQPEDVLQEMGRRWQIMKNAAHKALEHPQKSMGGLVGGEAARLAQYAQKGPGACGALMQRAVAYAVGVMEVNASMGLIVAAPTAGSAGVLPGGLLALAEEYSLPDAQLVQALLAAGAIGYLIMRNATVAGAEGGCQAEVGAASAMLAGAAVQLLGGSPRQGLEAAATALGNLLGLVCDPVGGLVEAPCQKRNAVGVANGLVAAQLALAGAAGPIPFDETVGAMLAVGHSLPAELRETALGGLAATPTACRLCARG